MSCDFKNIMDSKSTCTEHKSTPPLVILCVFCCSWRMFKEMRILVGSPADAALLCALLCFALFTEMFLMAKK